MKTDAFSSFFHHLSFLIPKKKPSWGLLSPQEMVEHLSATVQMSSGKKIYRVVTPLEKIDSARAFVYSDKPMPKNFKAPFFPSPPKLIFPSLKESVLGLQKEIVFFHKTFRSFPKKKTVHPVFGALSYKEWCLVHNKHFLHHFRQFGLIRE